ncbi:MAG TPA: tetratricopeptide repeat protein [Chloroflexia bacterium]|nr:tetratricopeptide repeat protein [Chloroflexia bacterium]
MNASPPFGQWLRERRQSLDMTREDLAEKVSCARVTIAKIEHGERRPSKQVAERLAEALRLPVEEHPAFVRWARGLDSLSTSFAHEGNIEAQPNETEEETPRTESPPASFLPSSPTSLIGREQEIAEARSKLWRTDVRLLTLTGPPGIGKTRLGLAVADALQGEFEHGVWFVPLAPLTGPGLVASSIAQALGVQENPGQPIADTLCGHVRDQRMLLLLDNFEHVTEAASVISRMLSVAPGLKVLATSRALLHVYGEHELPVRPLALPDVKYLPPVEELPEYSAVTLFVARTQAVKPDFRLSTQNARTVAEICVRLDGLPLAIELLAARAKLFAPDAMLARLDQRLSLLTGGPRDRDSRQQTLRGAIDWSYDLLEANEQALFRHISVFAGGCELAALEAVHPMPQPVLDVVESLVDKSLVVHYPPAEQAGDEPRFGMLETIREYALERLVERGEIEQARRQHAEYYASFSEAAGPELSGPEQSTWLGRAAREHDNLRGALRWTLDRGDAQTAARIAGEMWRFWWVRGFLSEGRAWLDEVIGQSHAIDIALKATALRGAGTLAHVQGDFLQGQSLFEESLTLYRELEDKQGIADGLTSLSNTAMGLNDLGRAQAYLEESLALYRELENTHSIAVSLSQLGNVAYLTEQYALARARYEESLALFSQLSDTHRAAVVLHNLGEVSYYQGEYARAKGFHEESLGLFRELGSTYGIAYALTSAGKCAQANGDSTQAKSLHSEALALFQTMGCKPEVAQCLIGIAHAEVAEGKHERAVKILGASEAALDKLGVVMDAGQKAEYDGSITAARQHLPKDAFEGALNAGRDMPIEEASAYALEASILS